jgi:hypothetical protein
MPPLMTGYEIAPHHFFSAILPRFKKLSKLKNTGVNWFLSNYDQIRQLRHLKDDHFLFSSQVKFFHFQWSNEKNYITNYIPLREIWISVLSQEESATNNAHERWGSQIWIIRGWVIFAFDINEKSTHARDNKCFVFISNALCNKNTYRDQKYNTNDVNVCVQ